MPPDELNRRNFHRLTAAALGGMVAGAAWGCGKRTPPAGAGAPATAGEAASGGALAASDKHLCRGLNDCKGQGAGGDNACRGQGQCATYEHHVCGGQNACKGQGGCGETVGLNDCSGKGGCHVPLMADAWQTVRTRKEQEWQANNVEFGSAPAAKTE